MTWWKHVTAYQPMPTYTTTTTWAGWRIVNPKCYGCIHSAMRGAVITCQCASRTMMHGPYGDTCMSYFRRR